MLANRLNTLLAERQLTIKQVVDETGISRSSISNIVNNPSANISTEVIDTLCRYLEISPTDFFIYAPYDIRIAIDGDELYFDVVDKKQEKIYSLYLIISDNEWGMESDQHLDKFDLFFDIKNEDYDYNNEMEQVYEDLPVTFQTMITNEVLKKASELLKNKQKISSLEIPSEPKNSFPISKQISLESFIQSFKSESMHVSIKLPWTSINKKIPASLPLKLI